MSPTSNGSTVLQRFKPVEIRNKCHMCKERQSFVYVSFGHAHFVESETIVNSFTTPAIIPAERVL